VLERGRRTWWIALPLGISTVQGNALSRTSSELVCCPCSRPVRYGRPITSATGLLNSMALLSHTYQSLQNALRRLYLSWTWFFDPTLTSVVTVGAGAGAS
jgi:hypothetical protein